MASWQKNFVRYTGSKSSGVENRSVPDPCLISSIPDGDCDAILELS